MNEFIDRLVLFENIRLYVIEVEYDGCPFETLDAEKRVKKIEGLESYFRRVRLHKHRGLWLKESMINLMFDFIESQNHARNDPCAWIDADIEFDGDYCVRYLVHSVCRALERYDVVQLFHKCHDLGPDGSVMKTFNSLGYNLATYNRYISVGPDYSHPGFAWAISADARRKIGGLYENAVVGSGDYISVMAWMRDDRIVHQYMNTCPGYAKDIARYLERFVLMDPLKIGYVYVDIRHHYHGQKALRRYADRTQILIKAKYDPAVHIERSSSGLIAGTRRMPKMLATRILDYLASRNEDDIYDITPTTAETDGDHLY